MKLRPTGGGASLARGPAVAFVIAIVAAFGVVLSPPKAEAAELGVAEIPVVISPKQDSTLKLFRDANTDGRIYEVGDAEDMPPNGTSTDWQFTISVNDDGYFRLINRTASRCLTHSGSPYPFEVMDEDCNDAASQLWYLQPVSDNGSTFLIREWGTMKCMVAPDHVEIHRVMVQDCSEGNTAQQWDINSAAEGAQETMRRMATMVALRLFDAQSDVIRDANYSITDSTSQPAVLGRYEIVSVDSDQGGSSPFCKNSSGPEGGDMTCQMSWSQSVASTTSMSHTAGVSVSVGTNSKSPVSVEVTAQYSTTWSESTTKTATSGQAVTIIVPPGQTAWIARALAYKTVTGTWTITNDMGYSWTGQGTASMPVEGIDGQYSVLIKCTTNSPDPGCWESYNSASQ